MANSRSTERISQIVTIEERLARDPRGLERLTVVGDMMLRVLEVPRPEQQDESEKEKEERWQE